MKLPAVLINRDGECVCSCGSILSGERLNMPKTLRITLKKSLIGQPEKHRRVVHSLGLRKLNKTVELKDTPTVRGMTRKVSHMLEVEEKSG